MNKVLHVKTGIKLHVKKKEQQQQQMKLKIL